MMPMPSEGSCVILGAGGHGRVLLDCLRASRIDVAGLLDPDRALWGKEIDGARVMGGDDLLSALKSQGIHRFAVGVGGVKDLSPRRRLFLEGEAAGLTAVTVKHPSAALSPAAKVGAGAQILPMSVVNAGASIGEGALINSAVVVEHDVRVGDYAHVSVGARLAGGVRIGALAFVGAGAVVREGVEIGERAVIGMGAIVLGDVEAGAQVIGLHAAGRRP
jgi:UDP-perosamine 4-acetyltransferase